MSIYRASIKLSVALALALFTTSMPGQSPANNSNQTNKKVAIVDERRPSDAEDKATGSSVAADNKAAAEKPSREDLKDGIAAIKAETAAVRDQLRRMEEQQNLLVEHVELLRRRLEGTRATDMSIAGKPNASADVSTPSMNAMPIRTSPNTSLQPAVGAAQATDDDRYRDGIVIWETPDDAKVPFLLKFNVNTQIRYLNTLNSNEAFTDHLGNVHEVHRRNDITVNRSMFILGGYIFDKRLRYSVTVWTSLGAASMYVAGNIGWQFNKRFTLMAGYTGVPGSRSLINTFPYYTGGDRSMADNFFRPGFTQGVWGFGELAKGLHYQAFVGNGLNTLNISTVKIDTHLLFSGSLWWEPLGKYGESGKSTNMYDDYFARKKIRIRVGTSFTRSREDRFSNLDQSTPENTSLYNSDGILTFSTGAFAPGVTVDRATYKMWAIDGGLKYNGLAVNGQYYLRWLGNFVGDGPIPLTATFDHGHELSASYFVVPKKLLVYARGSQVFGQFGNSYEYAGGIKWHFLPTERLWLNAEMMRIRRAPYSGAFTPYTAGMTGWVPMVQAIIAF
jgi:hypothetical protein